MARGKKLARRNEEVPGLEDSNDGVFSATSPPESLQIEQAVVQEAPSTQQDSEQIASSHQTPSTEQTPTTQQAHSATPGDSDATNTALIKRSSFVWDHFKEYKKIIKSKDAEGNPVNIEQRRAHCIHCPKGKIGDFNVENNSGTSARLNKNQKVLTGDKSTSNNLAAVGYNDDDYVVATIKMIVTYELPFSFVEKTGFKRFCARVCPLYNPLPSRKKLVTRFHKLYDAGKMELKKTLKGYRVSLTTDTWTSVQNINYMVLTAHFIDQDWKMHKRILNFCVIQNHQGATIGRLIVSCLLQWEIERVLTIKTLSLKGKAKAVVHVVD
ncbi:hypothetical protein ACLB2K_047748 [Fragaria x ananassa]